ncbi:hypothetical protein [Streptomyces avermitilis]|uniref:hypothetical protein n=1 Tax=Streptomyces avermitilis TaxID=33903 RepID=UPI0036CD8B43
MPRVSLGGSAKLRHEHSVQQFRVHPVFRAGCLVLQGRGECALPRSGETRDFEFTLSLDGPGQGGVALQDTQPPTGRRDPNPANDTAPVTVLP